MFNGHAKLKHGDMIRVMEQRPFPPPAVLVFAGLDPTGGAGIQADIEAIASMGGHALPVITATTIQDTRGVLGFSPTDSTTLLQQARTVLADMPVSGFKIGLVPDARVAQAIRSVLMDYPGLPVVIDPVLASGSGEELVTEGTVAALKSLLLPLATVTTPNSVEARALAPASNDLDGAAETLMSLGAKFVLVTGTHENTMDVVNTLFGDKRRLENYTWRRLPHEYHGSGCTLASAIGALLARGMEPLTAIRSAQEYAWQSLHHGYVLGKGQRFPYRFFWASGEQEHQI